MSRLITPLTQSFNAVAASSTATTKLARNRRYHGLILQYKTNAAQATIEADIAQIRIKVNSKVVRAFSAAELNLINAMNGLTFSLGLIPIWFSEPKRATPEGEEFLALLAYEDLGVGDVEVEVDIAAGAVAPTLTGLQIFDYAKPADQVARPELRTVMHWLRKVTPCAAAAPLTAPLTPPDYFPAVNGFLHRVHAFDAVITQIQIMNGETPFWDATTVQLPALLNPYGFTKQAATFHALIDANRQYVDGVYIPAVPSLSARFVASGAATGDQFVSIQEIRKPLDLS